ncbi:MAG: MFS transporter [Fuscovulum sp.]|nr:MFS transporter [Fuscovulum sp.]
MQDPLRLWSGRDFRLLFSASAATNLGDGLIAVAVPWLATLLTDDPLLIGLVAANRHLPWALFALPAGVLTDRHDHRRLILAADAARLLLSLALCALALTAAPGTGPVLGLAALAFLLGTTEVVRDNTAQTFLPGVVDKTHLERANGALWATERLAGQLAGPPLAGFLIGLSVALPFGAQTLLLLSALVLIGAMRVTRTPAAQPHQPALAAISEGLRWLWGNAVLRRLALVSGAFNFVGYGFFAIFILYAQRVLALDVQGYGALLTLVAVGGLAGSVFGPRVALRIGPTASLLVGIGMFSASSAALALQAPLPVIAGFMLADAFCGMLWDITVVSYRQRHIPAPLLGRVNSAYRFIGTGPAALGAFAFGAIVSAVETPGDRITALLWPYALASGVTAALAVYAVFRLRLR